MRWEFSLLTPVSAASGEGARTIMTDDFTLKVTILAKVRVLAADESVARKVIPTVLGSPSTAEIALANQNNAALGVDATIADVDFRIEDGEIALVEMKPVTPR
jgi:hypothetical protein